MPRITTAPPLTDARIEKLQARDDRYEVADPGCAGLRLRVMPSGLRVFRWYATTLGKVITIGPWARVPTPGHVTLTEARVRLHELKAAHRAGELPATLAARPVRPSRARDGEAAAPGSFAAVARDYLDHAETTLAWRSIGEVRRCVERDLIPPLGARPVTAITPPEIAAVVEAVARRAPSMAASVYGHARGIFTFAQGRGMLTANPVAALSRAALGAVPGERARILSGPEVGALWYALDGSKLPAMTRAALRVLLLTGVRTAELLGARWEEIDFEAGTWTIPPERIKAKPGRRGRLQPRVVPLAPQAIAQFRKLEVLAEGSPFVLASPLAASGHYSKKAISHGMERLFTGKAPLLTFPAPHPVPHDLRRTLRSGLSDLGVPWHVGERVLGHTLGKVADIYDRSDYLPERRAALTAWADRVAKLTTEHVPAKVATKGRR